MSQHLRSVSQLNSEFIDGGNTSVTWYNSIPIVARHPVIRSNRGIYMLMTADSLRKTQYEGTIIFLSFFFLIFLQEARRGSDGGEKWSRNRNAGKDVRRKKKEGKRSGGNGRSPGSSRFPYTLTIRGRQLVLEKERKRERGKEEGVRRFRERITASSDVYLGPDYLWLRLSRTAFERFIECLACAGHANSEPYVYSIWGWDGGGGGRVGWGRGGASSSFLLRAFSLDEFSLCR